MMRKIGVTLCVLAMGIMGAARCAGAARSQENPMIRSIEQLLRAPTLAAADKYLHAAPITITAFKHKTGPQNPHEYYSQGDYWWPDPKNPAAPYIKRDGYSNPDNFTADRRALIQFSIQTAALSSAYVLTRDTRYADAAIRQMNAWFVNPATRMNPNLRYAQAVHGRAKGRSFGIIDTIHLVEVAQSARILERDGVLVGADRKAVNNWFRRYVAWLTQSRLGREEMEARNNHGTCWVMQVAEFARLIHDRTLLAFCRRRFKRVLLPEQMAVDGSFPRELARTKPYGYSLFNLDAMCTLCRILSTPRDNLWQYRLSDGRGMQRGMDFLYPYIKNKKAWPYRHDVEYWRYWPVRSASLLFAGIALHDPAYLKLWEKLPPPGRPEEILRNVPIRCALLWLH